MNPTGKPRDSTDALILAVERHGGRLSLDSGRLRYDGPPLPTDPKNNLRLWVRMAREALIRRLREREEAEP